MRAQTKPSTVSRCVARQDGEYLVVTRDGQAGVSAAEIDIGAQVVIRDGRAERFRHSLEPSQ